MEENKPVLIFYGGEPLVNFNVLEYVAERINELRSEERCIPASFSMSGKELRHLPSHKNV